MREAELLRRARAGDPAAFEQLVTPCEHTVWRVCARMMGSAEDAADAMQEAMLKAWQSLGGYRGEAELSTWLYRIAVRCCLDALRRKKARPSESLEELGEGGFVPADPSDTPERAALRNEKRAMLRAALETLPEELRVPLVRSAVAGESYEAVAAAMGLPVGTVKSRISRARAALKKNLEQWNYFDDDASNEVEGGRSHDR